MTRERAINSVTRSLTHIAHRFAAKEAVIKAHPHRILNFTGIAILPMARPTNTSQGTMLSKFEQMQEHGVDKDGRAQEIDVQEPKAGPLVVVVKADGSVPHDTYASVSISHDGEYATAVCLAPNPGPSPAAEAVAEPGINQN